MTRIRSFLAILTLAAISAAFYSPPAGAQNLSGTNGWTTHLTPMKLDMRNTTAASAVVRNTNWSAATGAVGFTDSTVWRRGATTRTVYDTTRGYPIATFSFPPNIGNAVGAALQDSVLPWIVLRCSQDTVAYGFAGTSGGAADTFRVAVEYSYDGISWFSCSGTPTLRFDTVFMTSGADGLQSPTIFGVEATPGEDAAVIPIKCRLSAISANSYIANLTSCVSGNFVRFIVGGAYSGQYKIEALYWRKTS